MCKKINLSLFLACLGFCLTSLTAISHESFQVETNLNLNSTIGQKWINELVKNYHEGKFESRLATINAAVQKRIEEGTFDKNEAFSQKLKQHLTEGKKEIEELSARMEPYHLKNSQLKEESLEALKKVAITFPESEIAKSIRLYIEADYSNVLCSTLEKYSAKYSAIQLLDDILDNSDNHQHALFISIAKQYKLRGSVIQPKDFEMIEGACIGFPSIASANQYEIDSFLIRYEELQEALKIAQAQSDHSLISLINQAVSEYVEFKGHMHDINYLRLLANKSVAPQDDAEKQVAEIMSNYLAKQIAVIQEYFPASQE